MFCSINDAMFTTLLVRCAVQLELVDTVSSIVFGQDSMKKVNFLSETQLRWPLKVRNIKLISNASVVFLKTLRVSCLL